MKDYLNKIETPIHGTRFREVETLLQKTFPQINTLKVSVFRRKVEISYGQDHGVPASVLIDFLKKV